MKDELNNYSIANSDGASPRVENEGKVSYANDKSDYIRESQRYEQGETLRVEESVDESSSPESQAENYSEQQMPDASPASSVASASASVGGGIGALAGVVAASVVAAVVVVAVFLSTLAINLSLVMADMHSLTFEVMMTGANEKDFEEPIYAILTGENVHMEQEVTQDTVLLTFEDLEPGKEYRLKVKNASKVFAEVTAFTSTKPNEKGEVVSSMNGKQVTVSVRNVALKSTEFYTIIAKDATGKVVFSKDGIDSPAEYTFMLDEPKDLYFFLNVGGKTYALSEILLPDYDFANPVWAWSEDFTGATATLADKKGGEDLILTATVTRKTTDATCEKNGSIVYIAKVTYGDKTFSDKQSTVIESLGHDYEGTFDATGRITYTCSHCGDTYTD